MLPKILYLEVVGGINKKTNTISITIESFISLFIYKYLNVTSETIKISLINLTKVVQSENLITINLSNFNYTYCDTVDQADALTSSIINVDSDIDSLYKNCKLPVLVLTETKTIIAGICGVCRGIIKCFLQTNCNDSNYEKLLGFKGGCLLAPTETSIWTRFCEIDMINCIKSMNNKLCSSDNLKKNITNIVNIQLPDEMVKFEKHMAQPIRKHNIYKLARNLVNEKCNKTINAIPADFNILSIDDLMPIFNEAKISKKNAIQIPSNVPIGNLNLHHVYVEGHEITLADLILYAEFKILLKILPVSSSLSNTLPLTFKWFDNLNLDNQKCLKAFNFFNTIITRTTTTTTTTAIPGDINNKERRPNIEYTLNDALMLKNFSLYKSDMKRDKSKMKTYTKQMDIDKSLEKIQKLNINITSKNNFTNNNNNNNNVITDDDNNKITSFNWSQLPNEIQPEIGGDLPMNRFERKKHQLENLINCVLCIAKDNDRIVDFCSGTGHLGIVLAYLLPKCKIFLLENKEESLMRARTRCEPLHLTNIHYYQCNLDYFCGQFEIGCSLHACGIATDIVLQLCLMTTAKFVCCPCCYGNVQYEMEHIQYPRSRLFRQIGISYADYLHIAHCADQAHDLTQYPLKNNPAKCEQGQYCMDIIDTDRKLYAEESGQYKVTLTRLQPETCTPKNRLLIGIF